MAGAVLYLLYLTIYEVEREHNILNMERFLAVLAGGDERDHAETRRVLGSFVSDWDRET